MTQSQEQKTSKNDKKNWTAFTFYSPKIRKITNLLKNTNIGIAVKTTTTLHHLIKHTAPARLQEHEKKLEYIKLCARPATKRLSGRQVVT